MDYDIIYEKKYLAPGFIIYKKDFTQFLKIFPNINEGSLTYTFVVSDEYQDTLKDAFKHISFEIKTESPLYKIVSELITERNIFFSTIPLSEGYNQLRIERLEDAIVLTFSKDLTFNRNRLYTAMHLTTTGVNFQKFYQALSQFIETKEDDYSNKILYKMINLQATKQRI